MRPSVPALHDAAEEGPIYAVLPARMSGLRGPKTQPRKHRAPILPPIHQPPQPAASVLQGHESARPYQAVSFFTSQNRLQGVALHRFSGQPNRYGQPPPFPIAYHHIDIITLAKRSDLASCKINGRQFLPYLLCQPFRIFLPDAQSRKEHSCLVPPLRMIRIKAIISQLRNIDNRTTRAW